MKRVHILSAVNAANISKSGSIYTIRDVCGATDGIVMNRRLYPAEELAKGVASLNGKPAPAGHPKNAQGKHISAANGEALANSWIGAYCTNARHEAGRTLVDVTVNGDMAKAHPQGQKLVERLDAAIEGTNTEPIHVSTGLNLVQVVANGESRGKKYDSIATNLQYDHLAILMDEPGAGTPEQGVGMFLNSQGAEEPVEVVQVNSEPDDRRFEGLTGWVRKLLGNSELSFDQIHEGINKVLPRGAWLREVFPSRVIYVLDDSKLFEQGYEISENGSVALVGQAVEVTRQVSYQPITNEQESDAVKTQIIAALNAAGIKTDGLDDGQTLAAYNALVKKPVEDERDAEKEKVKKLEGEKATAENAERDALATELAVNSALTVDDLKALPLARLRELKGTAAPVTVGNKQEPQTPVNEFAGYSINTLIDEGGK